MKRIFKRADILLPQNCDMTKWSVVACDQFSSQPEYWAALESETAGVPSTLHLMFPEAYLETRDQFAEAEKINAEMRRYLDGGVFRTLHDSYVYLERTLHSGVVRRGLLGVLDLDEYDYAKDSVSPIRATEGTIESRLPPRVRVRSGAALEMPHIMVFIDDPADGVMSLLDKAKSGLPQLYDFDLLAGGGHLKGWQVSGAAADRLDTALDALADPAMLRARYGDAAPVIYAMGDGNHSLATAKKCWEAIKPTLSDAERETHPARFSLVELVNIHDPAITFEPIHKVLFETQPAAFLAEAGDALAALSGDGDGCHRLRLVTAAGERELTLQGLTIGQIIAAAEEACQAYLARHGGRIDYIHNDDTALEMGRRPDGAAILLPRMEKGELFPSIVRSGPFPKKSFSIGHAQDKRYYLECRAIR
ncbi:MAG: DUF1015 domain-containing protein [Ruminococcaceae bacterium]|nr:DUF1015 domain-containing protein [Oscillospiraceae bacterium]